MGIVFIIFGTLMIMTGFFIIFRDILWKQIAGGILLISGLLMALAGILITIIPGFFR
ncbi:MAG: hypothetical protein QW561_01900 [Candidatus Aenigmatarchaeota archaeon]